MFLLGMVIAWGIYIFVAMKWRLGKKYEQILVITFAV